jgi:hypothetical protein
MNTDNGSLTRSLLMTACVAVTGCVAAGHRTLVTVADARTAPATLVDAGEPGDSLGDAVVFDQPLLDEGGAVIGNNSGVCIRTRVAHSYQCQWTLTFDNGSIQVAGREADQGSSAISIVGGTGAYTGISGQMISTNNNDGTFTQTLTFRLRQSQ